MGLIELARGESVRRGYEYYKNGKVVSCKQTDEGQYVGKVQGSDGNVYDVVVDINHPRKTQCNCPFANGRRVVCKHAVATFFAVFPEEATAYKGRVDREEEEYEEWLESLAARVE